MIRISRPCYDKWWRCPGWAGGGMRYAKVDRCDGGSLVTREAWPVRRKWRFHRCSTCKVIVLPSVIRWVDPTWLVNHVPYVVRNRIYNWRNR